MKFSQLKTLGVLALGLIFLVGAKVQVEVGVGHTGGTGTIPDNGGLSLPADNKYDFTSQGSSAFQAAARGNLRDIIIFWTNFSLIFLGVTALVFLLYAGYQNLTAYGNSEQAKISGKIIWSVVVGMMLVWGAYALVNTVLKNLMLGTIPGS